MKTKDSTKESGEKGGFLDHHGDDDSHDSDDGGDNAAGRSWGTRRRVLLVLAASGGKTVSANSDDNAAISISLTRGEEGFVVRADSIDTSGTVGAVDSFKEGADGGTSGDEFDCGAAVHGEAAGHSLSEGLLARDQSTSAVVREGGDGLTTTHGDDGGVAVVHAVGQQGLVDEGPAGGVDGEAAGGIPGGGEADFEVAAEGQTVHVGADSGGFSSGEVPDDVPFEGQSALGVGVDEDEVGVGGGSDFSAGVGEGGEPSDAGGVVELVLGDGDTLDGGGGTRSTGSEGGGLSVNHGGNHDGDQKKSDSSEFGDHSWFYFYY